MECFTNRAIVPMTGMKKPPFLFCESQYLTLIFKDLLFHVTTLNCMSYPDCMSYPA